MSEEQQILMYVFLGGMMVIIVIVFIIKILNNSMMKTKYYNSTIYFDHDYTKHREMVEKQKIVLLKKKIQLLILTILVRIKEVFKK